MKKLFFTMAISMLSFGLLADSYLEDSAYLNDCGGKVELRSYEENGQNKYALKFIGVEQCSNVILSVGKPYKLTDKNGNFQTRSFTLSNNAVEQARYGLGVVVESNQGVHSDSVTVTIRDRHSYPAPQPVPRQIPRRNPQPDYEPAEWN